MNAYAPVVGVTMGDPVGIGPEIICRALARPELFDGLRPLVIGDAAVLQKGAEIAGCCAVEISPVDSPEAATCEAGRINVIPVSQLDAGRLTWGAPTAETGRAMVDYITAAVDMAMAGQIDGICTAPINKSALKMAGSPYPGHTELLAQRTNTSHYAMMMAGSRLRVVLVSIHVPLRDVPNLISPRQIETIITLCNQSLKTRFGIAKPRIAVAGLNPHAGEDNMFGDEESRMIAPAVANAVARGIFAAGPLPADTVFYHAAGGAYDAVVCMYHDQGLIPFKMIHFADGVNTTLGLPIVRTSVDHGTAYDIAGKGCADPGSLIEAVRMAGRQAQFMQAEQTG
ncbi:MAG: 4-hydroxythreonine-4-phosphate dehydrogenase PdxA [Thermodesulfobacteriota bacterium]